LENRSDHLQNENPLKDLTGQNPGKRLCIYIGESDRWRGKSLDTAILETLRSQGLAGATVYRGVSGFGAHSHIRSASIEVLSVDLPIMIEVVDIPERIQKGLEAVSPMVREGLITLEDVTIVKYTHRFMNPLPADRLVSEVMTKDVISLRQEMSVHEAWEKMIRNSLKALPVVDEEGKVVGILTDDDLLQRAGIQQRLSVTLKMGEENIQKDLQSVGEIPLHVRDVMTKPVTIVKESEILGSATSKMVIAGLKRLPVVNDAGRLTGMFSRLDVLRQVADTPYAIPPVHLHSGAVQKVNDIMLTDYPSVSQDDDLSTVVDKFVRGNTHRLIVVDASGKAVGLIADSDVISRVQPEHRRGILDAFRNLGKPPAVTETAFDLMSPGVITIPPDMSIIDASRKMLAEARKWLVVINEKEIPIGLIDRQTLLEALVTNPKVN
jgi:predicted transcriptional regulator